MTENDDALYTIRELVDTDHAEFIRLVKQPRSLFDVWVGEAAAGVRVTLVAEAAGKLIGLISALAHVTDDAGGRYTFDPATMEVDALFGSASIPGMLSALMEAVIEDVRERGVAAQILVRADKVERESLTAAGWKAGRPGHGFAWADGIKTSGYYFYFENGDDCIAAIIFKPGAVITAWYREPANPRDILTRANRVNRALREADKA